MTNKTFQVDSDLSKKAGPAQRRKHTLLLALAVALAVIIIGAGGLAVARMLQGRTNASSEPAPALGESSTTDNSTSQANGPDGGEPVPVAADAGSNEPVVRAQAQVAATPTVGAGEELVEVTPGVRNAGWARSDDSRNNRFGDSFLYAGVSQGVIFHGALQFDLSDLPRGAPLRYAALALTGLDEDRLDRDSAATWQVRWLEPEINAGWSQVSFQELHNAPVAQTILPPVDQAALAPRNLNLFVFSAQQRRALERALVDQQFEIAFRIDGPQTGSDNLFAWDTGYGPSSGGNRPKLMLIYGAAPATAPATPTRDLVVVTPTPTPENVITAAAIAANATVEATTTGTATPTPPNLATATPTAETEATAVALGAQWAVTHTPTPENARTAIAIEVQATAQARTTGTTTPMPTYYVTATPSPTFVVITNTPTPASAAELVAWAIAEATRFAVEGPATPIPTNVVTATPEWIVVTATPTPLNAATAEVERVMPTVAALVGTAYTPTPANMILATSTPDTGLAAAGPGPLIRSLSPTPTRTPAPQAVPSILQGKILFRSDRLGGNEVFVMDARCAFEPSGCPDSQVQLLRDDYFYQLARQRESLSPDGRSQLLVEMQNQARQDGQVASLPRVMVQESAYDSTRRLSPFEGAAYDAVWSPAGDRIAMVGTEPDNDEIYAINPDGSNLQRLTTNTWEWDKHPTWSPGGQQILFYSNRDTGRRQLWIMNADGSGQRNISMNDYEDWDPVWIK